MAKPGKKPKRKPKRQPARQYGPRQPAETQPAEVLTVAWTVTLTMALLCDLVVVVAHALSLAKVGGERMLLLTNLMLFSGALTGLVCLALLPVLLRIRRVPPPVGVMLFAGFVSLAPILVLMARVLL